MRSLQRLRIFFFPTSLLSPSKPTPFLFPQNHYSSSSDTKTKPFINTLIQQQINLLIPRLCSSNHLQEAIRLIDAALLTNPPLDSLSLSILIDRLSAEPDLTQSMSLLNRLKHNPNSHPSLLPIAKMLISSYFKKGSPRGAMKLFNWVSRPDSPCAPDWDAYAIVINGICRNEMIFEALKAVRAMVGADLLPGPELRVRVYRGLLREARIKEAQDVNEALGSIENGGESAQKVVGLLDHVISNWVD